MLTTNGHKASRAAGIFWISSYCFIYVIKHLPYVTIEAQLSQRGRAMLHVCLYSFNSTIPRLVDCSLFISYFGFRITNAYN